LNIVNLAHVHTLIQQMLPFDLFLVHHLGIGPFAGCRVVSLSGLRWIPLLLLIILAHDAHLLLLDDPALTVARLLHSRGLRLRSGDTLLVLGGAMAAHQLHLSLYLAQHLVHAAHGVDRSIHGRVSCHIVQVSAWRLRGGTGRRRGGGVLLEYPLLLLRRILRRLRSGIGRLAHISIVLRLKVIQHIYMTSPYIIV
jgi:hypothetical protein